jgi:predicted nucleotidyltransferase
MLTKSEVLQQIRQKKPELVKFGVSEIGLFGSYSRDQQAASSDIDILVHFHSDKENFDNYMSVIDLLERIFENKKVEVVTKNGMSRHIGPKILKEVLYL